MTRETFRILKETYYGKARNTVWDSELERVRYDKPDNLSHAEWTSLPEQLTPNQLEALGHDKIVSRIIGAAKKLSLEEVVDGFVVGCSGSWPRGRQTLISHAFARHLKPHSFRNGNAKANPEYVCEVCGIKQKETWDKTEEIFRLYWGYAWNEQPGTYLVELEQRISTAAPEVTPDDLAAFARLLRLVDAAPPDETPGALEKRLAKEKALPGTDKYRRYGVLEALAEVNILPNPLIEPTFDRLPSFPERCEASRKMKGSTRSDIVLPFGAWRGELGVNWPRARQLFPKAF